MGFKENLKSELVYSGMPVKELATRSGVNKRTIDNYLNTHNCMPAADAAVRIAGVLGVTVEYLINGSSNVTPHLLSPDIREIVRNLESLGKRDRKIVLNLTKFLKEASEPEQK